MMNDQATDEELLAASCAGQPEAFGLLVRRYESRLFGLLWGLVRHREVSRDLFQETWLRAYAARTKFRGNSRFSTWLYAIAVNQARNWKRNQKASLSLDDQAQEGKSWGGLLRDRQPGPLEALVKQEWQERYVDAAARLPEKYREVFVMIYQQEMSYEEAAAVVNQRVPYVRTLAFRAIQKMKVLLKEKA
jgi:RNA polymerase sigma-70 factor (ECF subfamily)